MDCGCDPHMSAGEEKNKDTFFRKSMPVRRASPLWCRGRCHHSPRWGQQGPGTQVLSSVSREPQIHGHACSPPSRGEQLMVFRQDDTTELYWQCVMQGGVPVSILWWREMQSCSSLHCSGTVVSDTTRRARNERAERCCLPEGRKPVAPTLKHHTSVVKVCSQDYLNSSHVFR